MIGFVNAVPLNKVCSMLVAVLNNYAIALICTSGPWPWSSPIERKRQQLLGF